MDLLNMLSVDRKLKKDTTFDIETFRKDFRIQLANQIKCLEIRLENHTSMLAEMKYFFKMRSKIELSYSQQLNDLVTKTMESHIKEDYKREIWPNYSTHSCWKSLLDSTERQGKDHHILGELYQHQMCNRLSELIEDNTRINKKCQEIGFDLQYELLSILSDLQGAMKDYHIHHEESLKFEGKFKDFENYKIKIEQQLKGSQSRKCKKVGKQFDKMQEKYVDNKKKALVARNEYLLTIDAANVAVKKYFMEDLPELIDTMDFGYHASLSRAMFMYQSAEHNIIQSRSACSDRLDKVISDLDQAKDKQRFFELYNHANSMPKKLDFQNHKSDELCQVSAQKSVQDDMLGRYQNMSATIPQRRADGNELWKTIETLEKSLSESLNNDDYDVSPLFTLEEVAAKPAVNYDKMRSDRIEAESFYIKKFQDYLKNGNQLCRLEAKYKTIQKALGEHNAIGSSGTIRPPSLPPKPRRKRNIGRTQYNGSIKVFGGSVEEHFDETGKHIPSIMKSCIEYISKYGKYHHGIFRVSGSQHEINDLRNSFERGDDPLIDYVECKDLNSVAGVLKLYFRELKQPLFPTYLFDELISCSQQKGTHEFVSRIQEIMKSLKEPVVVVMKYLFDFLHNLARYSDENMMDALNLGVCLGPTLLPIPPDRDQVLFQSHVNELMKNIITHSDEVFPLMKNLPKYEDSIMEEIEYNDEKEHSSDNESLEADSEEDEIDDYDFTSSGSLRCRKKDLSADAIYDFDGKTDKELSFRKGQHLRLITKRSDDWWHGYLSVDDSKEGLIPDKYISLKDRNIMKSSTSSFGSNESDKNVSLDSLDTVPIPKFKQDKVIDKSASQPNISTLSCKNTNTEHNSLSNRCSFPLGNEKFERNPIKSDNRKNSPTVLEKSSKLISELGESTGNIVNRPAERNFSRSNSLDRSEIKNCSTFSVSKPNQTPDLVLDLPINISKSNRDKISPPHLSTAEMFASTDHGTIKKANSMPRNATNPIPPKNPLINRLISPASSPVRRSHSSVSSVERMKKNVIDDKETFKDSPISQENVWHRENSPDLQVISDDVSKVSYDFSSIPSQSSCSSNVSISSPKLEANVPIPSPKYSPSRKRNAIIQENNENPVKPAILKEKPKPPIRVKPSIAKKPESLLMMSDKHSDTYSSKESLNSSNC